MIIKKTAIVLGATGLVGKFLVELLIQDDSFSKIVLLVRRATAFKHPKIEENLVNFEDISSYKSLIRGDVLFSCMGSTLKQAGSKDAQYKVDFIYQYEVAKAAAENDVTDYFLVSSSGANDRSLVFYSRIKGELDEAVKKMPFEHVCIFRPSVLSGVRDKKRKGEELGAKFINGLGKLIPVLKKYRSIKGMEVAKAMITAYKKPSSKKVIIYIMEEIFDLISETKTD
ncbi:MAG: NAD(P)H-binding protein [Bacteroidales bacterium]|nr:NAD(P)H-binding protein [Bacteroidales bacterium]